MCSDLGSEGPTAEHPAVSRLPLRAGFGQPPAPRWSVDIAVYSGGKLRLRDDGGMVVTLFCRAGEGSHSCTVFHSVDMMNFKSLSTGVKIFHGECL